MQRFEVNFDAARGRPLPFAALPIRNQFIANVMRGRHSRPTIVVVRPLS
jgi:hypothetical protein